MSLEKPVIKKLDHSGHIFWCDRLLADGRRLTLHLSQEQEDFRWTTGYRDLIFRIQRTMFAVKSATSLKNDLLSMQPNKWYADTSVRMFISYEQLMDALPDSAALERDFQEFEAHNLLMFGSKLALTIERDNGRFSDQYQYQVAADLLPEIVYDRFEFLQEYFRFLDARRGGESNGIRPIVTPQHILNFIKHVIGNHKFEGTRIIDADTDPRSASDAFRLVLGFGSGLARLDNPEQSKTQQLFCELVRNTLLLNRENTDQLIARFYKLLIEIPNRESDRGFSSTSMKDVFKYASGMSLSKLFSLGIVLTSAFAQASLFKNRDEPERHLENFHFTYPSFLKATNTSPDELPALQAYFSMSVQHAREELQKRVKSSSSFEYDLLPFMQKPILDIPNGVSILSYFPFLVERFTSSVYWTIFDFLKDGEKRPGAFEAYWGEICQKYIEEVIFIDVVRGRKHQILPFNDVLYKKSDGHVRGSDIILFDKQTKALFLFDVTFSALRVESLYNQNNVKVLSDGFEKLVSKAKQIDTVIKDIKCGVLKLEGIKASSIRRFHPYVVTMSGFPVWPFTLNDLGTVWVGLRTRLKHKGVLQESDVASLGVLKASEIEEVCAMQRAGHSIFELLKGWNKSERYKDEALHNYMQSLKDKKGDYRTVNSYHRSAINFALSEVSMDVDDDTR